MIVALKKICLFSLILCVCCGWVSAKDVLSEQADAFGTKELQEAVPFGVRKLLPDATPTSLNDVSAGILKILQNIAEDTFGTLYNNVLFSGQLLLTIVVCQLFGIFCGNQGQTAVNYAGTLAICIQSLERLKEMVGTGTSTIGQMTDFLMVLNPVIASAAAASGAVSGAGANYALTAFFSNLLLKLFRNLIIPVIYAYLALAMVDSIVRQERLKRLRELLDGGAEFLLKTVVYAFMGCLSVSGILTGSTDAAKLKAVKMTISGMIPVVGGMISGAAETVLNGAAFLKSAIGSFGMLVIFSMFLFPFLKLFLAWICVKLTTTLSGMLESSMTGLMEALSKATGYLVAIMGSTALICILSCCCYIKVLHL